MLQRRHSVELAKDVPDAYRTELLTSRPSGMPHNLSEAIERAAQEEREEIERDLRQAQNDHREIPNPFQDESLQLSGWLDKESSGRFQKRWQRRWCVLTNNSLVWYHNQYEDIPSGSIHLDEVIDISIVAPVSTSPVTSNEVERDLPIDSEPHVEFRDGKPGKRHHKGVLRRRSSSAPPSPPFAASYAAEKVLHGGEQEFQHYNLSSAEHVFRIRSGRRDQRDYTFRCETQYERDDWVDTLHLSKVRFAEEELIHEPTLMEMLVVMCCLKDQSGGRSFKFEFDNTLAEDMMAHQGMAAAVVIELILRNRVALQDGGKRLEIQDEQSTGVGVLDDVAALVKKTSQGGEGGTDNLSEILSRIAGVQLVAQPGLWDKIKDVFKVRWPIGPFLRKKEYSGVPRLRLPCSQSISDIWSRAVILAAHRGLISFESNVWQIDDDEVETRLISILRGVHSMQPMELTDREFAFIGIALAMMEIPGHEIIDHKKVFDPKDGNHKDILATLKKRFAKLSSQRPSKLSQSVEAVLQLTIKSMYSLMSISSSASKIGRSASIANPISTRAEIDQLGRRLSLESSVRPQPPSTYEPSELNNV